MHIIILLHCHSKCNCIVWLVGGNEGIDLYVGTACMITKCIGFISMHDRMRALIAVVVLYEVWGTQK